MVGFKTSRHDHQCLPQVLGCHCPPASITLLILFLLLQTYMGDLALLSTDISLWDLQLNWGGVHMIFVWWWKVSRCKWSCRHNWTPSLRQGMGGCWKAPMRYGFPSNHTNHHCWIQKGLWPCCSMGTSPPSPLPHSIEVAACKLVLLEGGSADWVYTFVQLNKALSHTPLSNKGHAIAMMDGMSCVDAHGHLHQLQVCKLLKHKDLVVCPDGLNGEMEASQFTFQELPLSDAASPGKPTCEPQLIMVDLSGVQAEGASTPVQTLTSTLALPTPGGTLSFAHITHPLLQTTAKDTRDGGHPFCHLASGPPRVDQSSCWMSYFSNRRQWMWPWSDYSQAGPPWIFVEESWS